MNEVRPEIANASRSVLLVGEAPSRRVYVEEREGDSPLAGTDVSRLAGLAGVSAEDFDRIFARVNLLDEWPGGVDGGGSSFPVDRARLRACLLSGCEWDRSAGKWMFSGTEDESKCRGNVFATYDRVVMLGRRVFSCFSHPVGRGFKPEWFVWMANPRMFCVVPHPSGVSRWWNDSSNVEKARVFWRGLSWFAGHRDACSPCSKQGYLHKEFPCGISLGPPIGYDYERS